MTSTTIEHVKDELSFKYWNDFINSSISKLLL